MTDKERWKIQNKLYRMKERKLELQFKLKEIKKYTGIVFKEDLLSKREGESFYLYLFEVVKLFLFHLDKVVDYYYLKFKSFIVIKRLKKVILTLTKEIKHYEQY